MVAQTGRAEVPAWFRGLFFVIGLGLLTAAALTGWSQHRFIKTAERVPGVVTQLNAGGSHPEVEFTTKSGKTISYPQGGLISGYKVGDKVVVLYESDERGQDACIDSFGALWFWPLLLSALGLVFTGSSVGLTVKQRLRE